MLFNALSHPSPSYGPHREGRGSHSKKLAVERLTKRPLRALVHSFSLPFLRHLHTNELCNTTQKEYCISAVCFSPIASFMVIASGAL